MAADSMTLTESKMIGIFLGSGALAKLGRGKTDRESKDLASRWMYLKKNSKHRSVITDIACEMGVYMRWDAEQDTTIGYWTGNIFTPQNYYYYGNPQKVDYAISTHFKGKEYVIDPDDMNIPQFINDGCMDVAARVKSIRNKGKRRSSKKSQSQISNLNNVTFKECIVGGLPGIEIVTLRYIYRNEQLYVDYGDQYWLTRSHKK